MYPANELLKRILASDPRAIEAALRGVSGAQSMSGVPANGLDAGYLASLTPEEIGAAAATFNGDNGASLMEGMANRLDPELFARVAKDIEAAGAFDGAANTAEDSRFGAPRPAGGAPAGPAGTYGGFPFPDDISEGADGRGGDAAAAGLADKGHANEIRPGYRQARVRIQEGEQFGHPRLRGRMITTQRSGAGMGSAEAALSSALSEMKKLGWDYYPAQAKARSMIPELGAEIREGSNGYYYDGIIRGFMCLKGCGRGGGQIGWTPHDRKIVGRIHMHWVNLRASPPDEQNAERFDRIYNGGKKVVGSRNKYFEAIGSWGGMRKYRYWGRDEQKGYEGDPWRR